MSYLLRVFPLLFGVAGAFVLPSPFVPASPFQSLETIPTVTLSYNDVASSSLAIADVGDIIRNVAVGLTGIVFFFAAVTFIYASFIIPQAAEQLEKETKELAPELWYEFQAKLQEGETMATRPDLMQDLGARIQPLMEQKYAAEQRGETVSFVNTPRATESTSLGVSNDDNIVDVEIIEKKNPPDAQSTL